MSEKASFFKTINKNIKDYDFEFLFFYMISTFPICSIIENPERTINITILKYMYLQTKFKVTDSRAHVMETFPCEHITCNTNS